jgi:hypothetical protein
MCFNVARRASVFILVLLGQTMAHANPAYEDSLRQVVEDATDVAVTRVDHRTPVTFVFDGEVHTCGFRYSGEVSRPLKGDRGTLEFFGSTELAVPDRAVGAP